MIGIKHSGRVEITLKRLSRYGHSGVTNPTSNLLRGFGIVADSFLTELGFGFCFRFLVDFVPDAEADGLCLHEFELLTLAELVLFLSTGTLLFLLLFLLTDAGLE